MWTTAQFGRPNGVLRYSMSWDKDVMLPKLCRGVCHLYLNRVLDHACVRLATSRTTAVEGRGRFAAEEGGPPPILVPFSEWP